MKGTTPTNSTARAPDHAAQQDVVPRPLKQPEGAAGARVHGQAAQLGPGADQGLPRKLRSPSSSSSSARGGRSINDRRSTPLPVQQPGQ